MKIDIHTHTKKTKTGDSENRNISAERFDEIIRATDVKILAITNHNFFDFKQYTNIKNKVSDICQIWPGIELDILEDNRRVHLLVIVSHNKVSLFNQIVEKLLENKTPDSFSITIEETVKCFDKLAPIYVAHYHAKKLIWSNVTGQLFLQR